MSGPARDFRLRQILIDPPGPFAPYERHLAFVRGNLDTHSRHHPQLRPHIRESLLLLRLFRRYGGDHFKVLEAWSASRPRVTADDLRASMAEFAALSRQGASSSPRNNLMGWNMRSAVLARKIAIWVLGLSASAILGMLAAGPPEQFFGAFHEVLARYPARPLWGAIGGATTFACVRLWFEDWRAES